MEVAALILAYLLGSLPFGYILSHVLQKTDIRRHGSGNIGATNVLRVMGWKAALPVFILDFAKGIAAVMIARLVSGEPAVYLSAGFLAMVGHSFPVFLKFKGGKAVATTAGVLSVLSGWVTISLLALFLVLVLVTRYVSLGSVIASMTLPVLFWFFGFDLTHIIFGLAAAVLITARHHQNISRLLGGTESKVGQKK